VIFSGGLFSASAENRGERRPARGFTSNSVTVYHAVTVVNSVINAWLMPLAYLALRRVHLRRPVTDTTP